MGLTLFLSVNRPGNNGSVERKANLAKIPLDSDAAAEEVLGLAQGGVTDDLLGCLVDRDSTAFYRYCWRQSTVALREGAAARLRGALNRPGFCGGSQSTGEWDDGSSTEVSGRAA